MHDQRAAVGGDVKAHQPGEDLVTVRVRVRVGVRVRVCVRVS